MQDKFFEGSEKKVELIVSDRAPSLRGLGHACWKRIVEAADAQILSSFSTEHCDAYLLSESSLFVFERKMLMITCGATHLVAAIDALLEVIPAEEICFLVFERKNELLPARQPTSFFADAEALNRRLPGRALRFGNEDEHHVYLYHLNRPYVAAAGDVTLELLMHGLTPESAQLFDRRRSRAARAAAIERILPGYRFAEHLFDPTGYSLNAVRDESYAALHVTPEEPCSYASFETNHPFGDDPQPLCDTVLELFRPRSFDLVLFDNGAARFTAPTGYELRARVSEQIEGGYQVRFMNHSLPPAGESRPIQINLMSPR